MDYRFKGKENVLSPASFSLGRRRNRCSKLLQLSESNWVTLAVVELRVYRCCGRRLVCVDAAIFTENWGGNQSVCIYTKKNTSFHSQFKRIFHGARLLHILLFESRTEFSRICFFSFSLALFITLSRSFGDFHDFHERACDDHPAEITFN